MPTFNCLAEANAKCILLYRNIMKGNLMAILVLAAIAFNLRAQTTGESQPSPTSAQSSKKSSSTGTQTHATTPKQVSTQLSDSNSAPHSGSINGPQYIGPSQSGSQASSLNPFQYAAPGYQPGSQPAGQYTSPSDQSGAQVSGPNPYQYAAPGYHSGSQPGAYYPGSARSPQVSTYAGPQHSGSQPGGGSQPGAYYPGSAQSPRVSTYVGPQHSGSQPGGGSQPGPSQSGGQYGSTTSGTLGGSQPGASQSGGQYGSTTSGTLGGSQSGGGSQAGPSQSGGQYGSTTSGTLGGGQPGGGNQPGPSQSGGQYGSTASGTLGGSQSVSGTSISSSSTISQGTSSEVNSSSKLLPAPSEPLAIYNTTTSMQSSTGSSVTTPTQPPVFGMVNTPVKISTTTSESTVPLSGTAAKTAQSSLPQPISQKVSTTTTGPLSVNGTPTASTVSGPDGRYYITSSHPPAANSSGAGNTCVVYATGLFNQESSTDKQFPPVDKAADMLTVAKTDNFNYSIDPNANIPVGSMIVWTDKPANSSAIPPPGEEFGDGHVGIVTAVSGNNLTIKDSNWYGNQQIQTFTISKADLNIESRQTNPNNNDFYEFTGFILPTPASASTTTP